MFGIVRSSTATCAEATHFSGLRPSLVGTHTIVLATTRVLLHFLGEPDKNVATKLCTVYDWVGRDSAKSAKDFPAAIDGSENKEFGL